MIVDVTDYEELQETAIGWMCLAWQITIDALQDFEEWERYFDVREASDGEVTADELRAQHWYTNRFKMNNAISLMQQSMELFLKARIAKTSPYLLLVGDPMSWPGVDRKGEVSFADFQTIDSSHLLRAATIVGSEPLHTDFNAFYERVRRHRNKIIHLNAGNIVVEARRILVDILTEFDYLLPGERWPSFRRQYLDSTREGSIEGIFDREHSILMWELEIAINVLESKHTKKFFGYDKRKKHYFCPKCYNLQHKHDEDEHAFIERGQDDSIFCIACQTLFTRAEYIEAMTDWKEDYTLVPR